MDPLEMTTDHTKGYHPQMAYLVTLHTIAIILRLAMALSKWQVTHNIYEWQRDYPACVPKVGGRNSW